MLNNEIEVGKKYVVKRGFSDWTVTVLNAEPNDPNLFRCKPTDGSPAAFVARWDFIREAE